MAYFFQIRPKQKTIVARYTNHPLVSIPSQNRFLIRRLTTQDGYPNSAGMAYFFQTRLKQKMARYTNHTLVSIPSQNRFLIRASQHPESRHFKKCKQTDRQTHGLFSIDMGTKIYPNRPIFPLSETEDLFFILKAPLN